MGAHQKIDRAARKQLTEIIKNDKIFPGTKAILQFEGKNGPDAIKRKSPSRDEPWHYYSPFDNEDSQLIELIKDHYKQLVNELKQKNAERTAFEAAWLAHALVDGLTPAHHYPYEQKLVELSGGQDILDRTTIFTKWVLPGINTRQRVKNNWKMWGPKGLITTHGLFELGVALLMMPLSFEDATPSKEELKELSEIGLISWFINTAREIAVIDIYDIYYRKGWTPKLARIVRNKLGPSIVKTVTLAWYSALLEAGLVKSTNTK
ncbi:MAG TPA: hypothetical protein VMR34_02155 [Candidatus Saccharimonadales bacterium]|nr:hypothetical protein [Candidatus Saccharimonadales bacterium]